MVLAAPNETPEPVASFSEQRSQLTNNGWLSRFDRTAAHRGPLVGLAGARPDGGPCSCARSRLGLEPDVSRLLSGPENHSLLIKSALAGASESWHCRLVVS
ncbi:hypothetical protein V8C34DRAFT_281028 [Trichoderma compactum]